jgi:hypothetical protein
MRGTPACPRCGRPARAPGVWSNTWRCDVHGDVEPVAPPVLPTPEQVQSAIRTDGVPFWFPWPLPAGWLATGMTWAGDERHGSRASVLACSGPNPLGGPGELLVIAEEPGVGLGAYHAGMQGRDPGEQLLTTTGPHAKIYAGGHPTALWCVEGAPDRAVYVGEALGRWLYLVLWPASAGALVADHITLVDLRDAPHDLDIPLGAPCPRLAG